MPGGRPTDYNLDIAKEICHRLITPRTLKSICTDEDMPARATVYDWLVLHKEFADMYTRAREVQVDAFVDEIFEIADDKQGDTYCDEYGNEKQNHEYINRARLRTDVRKWYASKVYSKMYGDKSTKEEDLAPPAKTRIIRNVDPDSLR